ncbi:MAG: hypothetical protein IJN62_01365 [Clostridia bacterium]|nr:hypothetical protein [Clostridia bacterium]
MSINCVLGKVDREDLGIVTPHEHIFINLSAFFEERPLMDIANPAEEKVKMEHLGQLNRDPYALKDNLTMDDYEIQKKEILRFKKAGGATIVDATMPGIGREPETLAKISAETGINVVMGTGYYVTSTHPDALKTMTEDEIADEMVKELTEGVNGIKAGVIGEIGISEIFDDAERRVLRASAIAHKKTGAGVLVHINPWTTNGIEAAEILLEKGVSPDRIAISHIDVENTEDYVFKMLDMGVYVEFDNFGKEYYVDAEARRDGYGCFVTDVQRVEFVKKLIDKGYVNQILLSCDVCLKTLLRTYGGWGYDHVLVNIVPMMKEAGISDEDINIMLKNNPINFLCGRK